MLSFRSCLVFAGLLSGRLEGEQGLIPELIEVGSQGTDPLRVQLVQTALPIRTVHDQARLLQHAEVLGHGRTTDWELTGQLAHPTRPVGEAFEDAPPSRIPESVKLTMGVSCHLLVSYNLPLARSR